MKYAIVLVALFACALSAEHKPRWVLPRLPLSVLLSGKAVMYDANDERIVGGAIVPANSVPFQIHLDRMGTSGFSLSCGGSILDANVIINAAHCVRGVTDTSIWEVVAGDHSMRNNDGTEQRRSVRSFTMHENYGPLTKDNDISLIFLTSPLDLSVPQVKAVNLPANSAKPADGTTVTVTGWGTTSSGGVISDQLRTVDVQIVSNTRCNTMYGAGSITNQMICASAAGSDSCQGDSGGPLFTGTGAAAVQHGIVSWGNGCADARYPGVYAHVGVFLDWIALHRND